MDDQLKALEYIHGMSRSLAVIADRAGLDFAAHLLKLVVEETATQLVQDSGAQGEGENLTGC